MKGLKRGRLVTEDEADDYVVERHGAVAVSEGFDPYWMKASPEIIALAKAISDKPKSWERWKQQETAECMIGGWDDQAPIRAMMRHGQHRYRDLRAAAKALKVLATTTQEGV